MDFATPCVPLKEQNNSGILADEILSSSVDRTCLDNDLGIFVKDI